MFRGINAITIDAKGRLALPARYRDTIDQSTKTPLVVTIDTEEACLLMYPITQWQLIEEKIQQLPSFNPMARRIQRLLIGHATELELDANGRVLLPSLLREYANLDKKVVMIGQGNKFELWDDAKWFAKRQQWLTEDSNNLGQLPDEMGTLSL
jgi:MraZ protein